MTRKEENEIYNEGLNLARKAIHFKNTIGINEEEIIYMAAANYLLNYDKYDESKGEKSTFVQTIVQNLINDELRKKLKRNEEQIIGEQIYFIENENVDNKIDYKILKNKIQTIFKQKFNEEQNKTLNQYFFDENYGINLNLSKNKSLVNRAKNFLKENLNGKKKIKEYELDKTKKITYVQKNIFEEYYIKKTDVKTIAKQMGCTKQNIYNYIQQIKKKLK